MYVRLQKGKTALELASRARKRDTVMILRDADDVNRLELRAAIMHGDVEKSRQVLQRGLDLGKLDAEVSRCPLLVLNTLQLYWRRCVTTLAFVGAV